MSAPHYPYTPIATQPTAHHLPTSPSLDSLHKESIAFSESRSCTNGHGKGCSGNQCSDEFEGGHTHGHKRCHKGRTRQFILPLLISLIGLLLIGAAGCLMMGGMSSSAVAGVSTSSSWGLGDIFTRAVADTANGNGNDNPFINKKLYLIIIFVGLVLVVIAAIMLSAWCCRGAFNNPLCCPCYLCACCGGLVCLECIGCGLCAEGISEM